MKNIVDSELKEYLKLIEEQPELFTPSDLIPIETDVEAIESFVKESGRKIGVIYKSDYNMLINDLIKKNEGGYYIYERVIPTNKGGVVVIVRCGGKFILLKQFRHAIREYQYGFVRGYGEKGISLKENAAKETREELGVEVTSCEYIGEIIADSGLSGGRTSVFLCHTDELPTKSGHEGIQDFVFLSEKEIEEWISANKINDSFTLAAYSVYKTKEMQHNV